MAGTGKSVTLVDGDPQATSRRWLVRSDLPVHVEALDLKSLSSLELWLGRAERLVRSHGTVIVDLPAVVGPAMAFAEGRWIGDLVPGSRAHNEVMALEAAVAEAMRRTLPAPRIEAARPSRRERERSAVTEAAQPPERRKARPWWQRIFAS